ncbi:hypothetical protein [Streptomyces sp. NPDC008317]|uniref:hypothetical protein n=1 Tax=Streptomyces sp. NPDC008317 TaxID=3364827 RepID=UPI0036EFA0AA
MSPPAGEPGRRPTIKDVAWDDSQVCQLTPPKLSAMSHDVFGFGAEVARRLLTVLRAAHPRGDRWPPRC